MKNTRITMVNTIKDIHEFQYPVIGNSFSWEKSAKTK